jgi:hypothetical protein
MVVFVYQNALRPSPRGLPGPCNEGYRAFSRRCHTHPLDRMAWGV